MSIRNTLRLFNFSKYSLNTGNVCSINCPHSKWIRTLPSIKSSQIHCFSTEAPVNNMENTSKNLLLYTGPLTTQIKRVKIFSFSTSGMGFAVQPVFYQAVSSTGSTAVFIGAYSFLTFFTLVTPFALHFITKKYVTQLEYNEKDDTYIATTLNFFCIPKRTVFKAEQVVVPDVPGMFTSVIANGKAMFFDLKQFEDPSHYGRLMGYDKPIDLKLGKPPQDDRK